MNKTRVLFILFILLIVWGNFPPFKSNLFFQNKAKNPRSVHFVRFVDLMGGPKMNKTRVLFILFILFILLWSVPPLKKQFIIEKKRLKPAFCSFCSFCPSYLSQKMNKTRLCSFCSFFLEDFPPFKSSIIPPKCLKLKPALCSFCSFCSFCFVSKMNKARVLFILFILGGDFPLNKKNTFVKMLEARV